MRLTDRVEILDLDGQLVGEFAAQVGYSTKLTSSADIGAVIVEEKLTVIVRPVPVIENGGFVRWRGKTYPYDGRVKIHRKNGRDHHFTITLGNDQ